MIFGLIFSLLFSAGLVAEEIRVQGRGVVIWKTIDDGDLNPDQDVTDFGTVNYGSSDTRNYRIQNRSNRSIIVKGVSSSDAAFTILGLPAGNFTIAANDKYEFQIRFNPTVATHQSTILVRSTASEPENFYNFAITGDGSGPDIQVRGRQGGGEMEIITPTGAVTTQNGTSFGTRLTGNIYTNEFIIENLGNAPLNLGRASIIGADADRFEIDLAHNPNIQAGESRNFEIHASGPNPGTYLATVSIPTNDFDEDPFTFPIRVILLGRPLIEVRWAVGGLTLPIRNLREYPETTTLSMNDTVYGESRDAVFEIHNPGNGELEISSITSSAGEFGIVNFPPTVGPGATKTMTIRFTPSSASSFESFFAINNNSRSLSFEGTDPYTFRLKGNGTPAPNPTELRVLSTSGGLIASGSYATTTALGNDFGNRIAGEGSVTKNFVLHNAGENALEITEGETPLGSLFVITAPASFPITIAPGETSLLSIRASFRRNPGIYTGTVSLGSNDPVNSPYIVPLSITLDEPPAPVITSFEINEGKIFLKFSSALDVSYVIQQSATLEEGSWEPVPGFGILTGRASQVLEIPIQNGFDRLFYRIARP